MIVGGLIALAVVGLVVYDVVNLLSGNGGVIFTIGDSILNFVFNPSRRVDPAKVVICSTNSACSTLHAFLYSAVLLLVVITGFAYTTLLERKFIAWFQQRVGPNRVGPMGLMQPAADAVKLITKEDITPAGVSYWVWFIAPMIKAVPVLVVLAVIPLGPDIMVPWFDGLWYQVPLGLSDPSVGVLYILGITSIGTYGIVLAGWASNNKYSMLGGLRASAQMISYELTLGLGMAVPVMIVGSMALGDITKAQPMIWNWFIFQNPLAAAVLFIALLAEVSRAPFDLVEAEQELTAGFMTEYSGMKFALFMMAEYLGMIAISLIFSALYLGGYQDGFGLTNSVPILGPLVMIGKTILLLIFMVWIRATLPRIRYDRLMQFGWKILLPLALVSVLWTAISLVVGDAFQSTFAYGIAAAILFVVVVGGAWLYLRNLSKTEEVSPVEDMADDPIVSGAQTGIGWSILTFVGALLAIPFSLLSFLIDQLQKIAATSPNYVEPKPAQKPENPSVTFAKQYGTFGGEALPAQKTIAAPAAPKAVPAATEAVIEKPAAVKAEAVSQANPADTAAAPKPAAGGKAKFDKEAMLAKIREKKANK
ncbi:MAG: NADH-quinone oxidoreductase subunit NuoH [Anaerolineae bacterium]|nr:NADH-quinone oxidoreductase subunit NuoH [Anaerolineae bacterium]